MGTASELRAYDAGSNADVFCREAPDGCSALGFGRLGQEDSQPPLVFLGGSCSIYGYNASGHDAFWTVSFLERFRACRACGFRGI